MESGSSGYAQYGSIQQDACSSDAQRPPRRPRPCGWYVNMLYINLVELGSEGARGLVLPSMYLYQLRLGGSATFMCLLISAFSLGRVISSTLLGLISDRRGCRSAYVLALLISAAGNTLYALCDRSALNSRYMLLVARFIVGFGAGNRAVCRADVAALTASAARLRWITILSATIFAGYALTPGLGSAIAKINGVFVGMQWNEYNAPGAILALYNLLLVGLAYAAYDVSVTVDDAPAEPIGSYSAGLATAGPTSDAGVQPTSQQLPGVHPAPAAGFSRKVSVSNISRLADGNHSSPSQPLAADQGSSAGSVAPTRSSLIKVGIWLCIGLNFTSRGILCILETVMTPLYLTSVHEPPTSPTAVLHSSEFQLAMGAVGLVTFIALDRARRRVAELMLLAFAFAATAVGCMLLTPNLDDLSLGRFVVAELLAWSIGSPISGAVVIASFSKIIGKGKQGKQMGLIGSAGSLARIIMPLILGGLPGQRPFETEFIILSVMGVVCCAASVWFYSRVRAGMNATTQVGADQGGELQQRLVPGGTGAPAVGGTAVVHSAARAEL